MPAYWIVVPQDVSGYSVDDPTELDPYSDQMERLMIPYGGRYLRLRRHPIEALEGDWQPLGMAMIEFPSWAQARAFYDSDEYAPLLAWRKARGRFNILLVDGIPEGMTSRKNALEMVEQARAERAQRASGPDPE